MFRRELTITHLFERAFGDKQNAASIHDIQNLQFQPYCVDGREGVSIFYLYDARLDAQGSVSAVAVTLTALLERLVTASRMKGCPVTLIGPVP